MDDQESNDSKNVSAISSSEEFTSDDEDMRLCFTRIMEMLNESPTASNFFEMLTNIHSNGADEVLMSTIAEPCGLSSTLDDTFQTSGSLSNLLSNDIHAQQQFQGVNDNPRNCMEDELLLPVALFQADNCTPDLHIDREMPPICERSDPAEANQDDTKIIQHSADDQTEEFLHRSASEPLDSGKMSFPFPRGVCGKEYSSKKDMDRPTQIQTEVKQFKCHECGYETLQKENLKRHMQTWHTGEKPYKCKLCNFESARKIDRSVHMRRHTGEKPYKCKLCNFESVYKCSLTRHTLIRHSGERPYKCDLCSFESATKGNLSVHMRRHTGEKPYKCKLCNFKSARKDDLSVHSMRRHTGEKPYKCKLCNFESVYKCSLTKHTLRRHSGEKLYKCDLCNFESATKGNLSIHMRRHTGAKPYKCNLCSFESTTKGNLTLHNMRRHTGKKPYKCELCNYKSATKYDLSVHIMQRHTGEKPYKCKLCNFESAIKGNLKKHMLNRHKQPLK